MKKALDRFLVHRVSSFFSFLFFVAPTSADPARGTRLGRRGLRLLLPAARHHAGDHIAAAATPQGKSRLRRKRLPEKKVTPFLQHGIVSYRIDALSFLLYIILRRSKVSLLFPFLLVLRTVLVLFILSIQCVRRDRGCVAKGEACRE